MPDARSAGELHGRLAPLRRGDLASELQPVADDEDLEGLLVQAIVVSSASCSRATRYAIGSVTLPPRPWPRLVEVPQRGERHRDVDRVGVVQQAEHAVRSLARARQEVVPVEVDRRQDAEGVVPVPRRFLVDRHRLHHHDVLGREHWQLDAVDLDGRIRSAIASSK